MKTKKCACCGEVGPARIRPDGYARSYCKKCECAKVKKAYASDPENWRERARERRRQQPESAREATKRCHAKHHEERIDYSRAYNEANRERKREGYAASRARRTPEQRESIKVKERPMRCEIAARRRARKKACEHIPYRRSDIVARDRSTCYLCGSSVVNIELDHVVPIARGGADVADNVRVACRRCNARKGDKLLSELDWYTPPAE